MAALPRKKSSGQRRREALLAAAQVRVPRTVDVAVVGGGASGLAAALCAARQHASVVVLEADPRCGKPILATGNGRCNVSNACLDPHLYNDPTFVEAAAGSATVFSREVRDFLTSCGLAIAEEEQGRLYPYSRQASSVRDVLLRQAQQANVLLAPARRVTRLEHRPDGQWNLTWTSEAEIPEATQLQARAVIVATGGNASTQLVSDKVACEAWSQVLCPLACEPLNDAFNLADLDGRRVRAQVSLARHQTLVMRESGEVLFRPWGLSGIVIMNLSRYAQPGDILELDLLSDLDAALARGCVERSGAAGILDPVVATALGSGLMAFDAAQHLQLRVVGPAPTEQAQVHRGGIATRELNPATLALINKEGLFAAGEAIAVDGPCGGYNLGWAWRSGCIAGSSAATFAHSE